MISDLSTTRWPEDPTPYNLDLKVNAANPIPDSLDNKANTANHQGHGRGDHSDILNCNSHIQIKWPSFWTPNIQMHLLKRKLLFLY